MAFARQERDGVDQDIDAFEHAQLAHENQIGGAGFVAMGSNSARVTPLWTTRVSAPRLADFGAKGVSSVRAFE